jgi:acyl-CoA thioesterase-2
MTEAPSNLDPVDPAIALAQTIEFLTVRRGADDGCWIGQPPEWFGPYLFGGFVIAQGIAAATQDVEPGRRLHSLHAYFLRPATTVSPIVYTVRSLRAGRSFATNRIEAEQAGKPVLEMTCSFTADTEGYVYDLPGSADVPALDASAAEPEPGPWVAVPLGPTPARPDGTRESTHRHWFRIPVSVPDDPHLHAALLGFATDWTGIGGRPLHLDGDTTGMVSLDHAAWFHRPARVDEWLYYDVHSLVNAGGRGLLRGVMRDRDGRVVASVAQEMRLSPVEETSSTGYSAAGEGDGVL